MQRTKWLDRKFNFDFPAGLLPVVIARLSGTLPHLMHLVNNLSDEQLESKPDNKWSIKEQIGHLASTESLHEGRIYDIIAHKEELRPAGFKPLPDYNEEEIGELLSRFEINREKFLLLLKGLDDEIQNSCSLHPRLRVKLRPVDIAFFAAEHDDHHIASILEYLTNQP
jgi:uncharacterized damage-inducible protein DinB